MKAFQLFGVVPIFFSLVASTARAEYGRVCGTDAYSGGQVCFVSYPNRHLDFSAANEFVATVFDVSPENATVRWSSKTNFTTEYQFSNPSPASYLKMSYLVIEPGRYPGDGEYELTRLEGVTPTGRLFLVTDFHP